MAKGLLKKLGFKKSVSISKFKNRNGPPKNAANLSGIEGLFWSNEGPVVHKWHHYLPIYEKYFSQYKNSDPKSKFS